MPLTHSIQGRLTVLLSTAVLVVGLLSTVITTAYSFLEAKEYQDDMLRQIAWLASGSKRHEAPWLPVKREPAISLADGDARIQVIFLPEEPRPDWLPVNISSALFTCPSPEGEVRVLIAKDATGRTLIITQPTESRDELAWQNAIHSSIPTVLLLPALTLIIWLVVRRQFRPVRELATYMDRQRAGQPLTLPRQDIPAELTPFIHALNRLLERLQNLLVQQRRFVANAAHELRTPLAAFSLQVQNLGNAATKEEMQNRLQILKEGLQRTSKLTEQLLNLARVQSGAAIADPVDISRLARELIAEYLPLAEAKHINLGLGEEEHLLISASFENIHLILKNGLENAVKYTENGGIVTIRLARSNNTAVLEVSDNGPGIVAAEKEQVFFSFHRAASSLGSEGSGLGLAIAWEAAAILGGSLSLHDQPTGSGLIYRYVHPLGKEISR